MSQPATVSNNCSVSVYRGLIMIIPRTGDRFPGLIPRAGGWVPGHQIPPDQGGGPDRIRAKPASDLVHRPLGVPPRQRPFPECQLGS